VLASRGGVHVHCTITGIVYVGYRVCAYAYTCTLHTICTTRDGTVYMYTTTTLVCSTGDIHQPQDPGTRYACRSGMHTCMYDAHYVVCIYSTVYRSSRAHTLCVCSPVHSVGQYVCVSRMEMAGSTPQHPCIPWSDGMCISVSLYLRRRCVYTSTLYHSMYTTGCSTGMYLHHCWYAM